MSTEIKSSEPGGVRVATLRSKPGSVVVNEFVQVSRTFFLAAVETECGVRIVPADAAVIPRAELPEVTAGPLGVGVAGAGALGTFRAADWDHPRERALVLLALAEYLDAHPPTPPVDEADVGALAGLVDDAGVRAVANASSRLIARRLLATGRVSVTP